MSSSISNVMIDCNVEGDISMSNVIKVYENLKIVFPKLKTQEILNISMMRNILLISIDEKLFRSNFG